jgi:hypothetical protein
MELWFRNDIGELKGVVVPDIRQGAGISAGIPDIAGRMLSGY